MVAQQTHPEARVDAKCYNRNHNHAYTHHARRTRIKRRKSTSEISRLCVSLSFLK